MMIAELTITDFAIIDRVQLQLAPGFNVLTGETGAGKSIIVDALSQLLGSSALAPTARGSRAFLSWTRRSAGCWDLCSGSTV
jgi:DNA repair protein RecN (Recombination protein N)